MSDRVATTILLASLCIAAFAQTNNKAPQSPSVRHFVAPVYPASAWLARVQGTVVTEVTVNPDGTLQSVKIISAHPLLREAVESATKQWLFHPISLATTLQVTTRFQLDADCPQSGSDEPDNRYYIPTQVSADFPSSIEVRTCLPIITINSDRSHR